eukprot:9093600-Pyramimonas_sp.AAC.1
MPLGYNDMLGIFVPEGEDPEDSPRGVFRRVAALRPFGLNSIDNTTITGVAFKQLGNQRASGVNEMQRGL